MPRSEVDREPWMLGARAGRHDAGARRDLLTALRAAKPAHPEWVVLETCHRVELYGFGPRPKVGLDVDYLNGADAILHLMRVAAGLDSAIVGEDEVLHQVRGAMAGALAEGHVDRRLLRLFETAIAAGRNARRRRRPDSSSLSQRAVDWLNEKVPLDGQDVLVVGAGHMGSRLAHHAKLRGARVTSASRSPLRARRLSTIYGARSDDLEGAAMKVYEVAAVGVALGGPWRELEPSTRSLPPIADISAPPAIDPSIRAGLNGGFLGIDDLYTRDLPAPVGYVENANRHVAEKAGEYAQWLIGRS